MSKIRGKGTVIKQTVSGTPTAIAQVISIDIADMEVLTYPSPTLDGGVGVPYDVTGETEGGSWSLELFFDPALAGHTNLLLILKSPISYADQAWTLIFADSAPTSWTFVGAGIGFGGTVVLNDGLKATITIKADEIPDFTPS